MPSSVNGCGTRYYGKRRFNPDGSYITTNFVCLLFIPLIPLHSVRVTGLFNADQIALYARM